LNPHLNDVNVYGTSIQQIETKTVQMSMEDDPDQYENENSTSFEVEQNDKVNTIDTNGSDTSFEVEKK